MIKTEIFLPNVSYINGSDMESTPQNHKVILKYTSKCGEAIKIHISLN